MSNFIPAVFQLQISTTESPTYVMGLLSALPLDNSTKLFVTYHDMEMDDEPELKFTSVTVSFETYKEKDFKSATRNWATALIKMKQGTIKSRNIRYGLFSYDMDTEASRYGMDTFVLEISADYNS